MPTRRKNQPDMLEQILEELKQLNVEIQSVRDLVSNGNENRSVTSGDDQDQTVTNGKTDQTGNIANVTEWLSEHDVTIKAYRNEEAADAVFDKLATYLGQRFDSLQRIHDKIRSHLSPNKSFTLSLAHSNQEEINNTTQFCTMLHKYAFLSNYRYNRSSKTIHAQPQKHGKVINFFTGGWFERYILLEVLSLLDQNELEYTYLSNPQIILPNGDDFEFDMIFLVNDEPLWIECKTGEYSAHITKYAATRSTLDIPKENSILTVLGIGDELSSELTDLYDITVASENTLPASVAAMISLSEIPTSAIPSGSMSPDKLATHLNRAGLRPLVEVRSKVLAELVNQTKAQKKPITLKDMKDLLADKTGVSKSKLQDILTAVVRSKCLLNSKGKIVRTFNDPFSSLSTWSPTKLEYKCIESYIEVMLKADASFFEYDENIAAFEQVTGLKIEDDQIIDNIKERIQID